MSEHPADAAARADGIQPSYLDNHGDVVSSPADVVAAVGEALTAGRPTRDTTLDVVVAWDGIAPRLPDDVTVHDADGTHLDRLRPLPLGYHVVSRGGEPVGTLISAPRHAPPARAGQWGILLPLYSLRTARTRGIARYPELRDLFDWLDGRGGTVLLTLPLLPTYLDDPADWSPYSPVTRHLWSELYVDLDPFDGGSATPPPEPHHDLLDYPALYRHQAARLDAVAERLAADADLHRYAAEHPLALDHARFRGAQATLGRNFRSWPGGRHSIPDGAVDRVVERRHLVGSWLAERQLAAVASTARDRGQCLALDLALGTHGDGFDVWRNADLFVEGFSVGAPPDPIFAGGQDWGFPPVHPAVSRSTAHRELRDTLRHHLRHAGLLRLDHVMGLSRQWWVPHGRAATDGVYVTYPFDELLAIVCLEAHLAGAVVVGENLGTVPEVVDHALVEHRLLGIHVGQEALPTFGSGHVRRAREGTMAMLTTHDSVPFASWWEGGDIRRGHRMGLMTDAEAERQLHERGQARGRVVQQLRADHRLDGRADLGAVLAGVAEDLAGQPAEVVVLNLEDMWLEVREQNTPGTFQEVPNWRRVAARTVEQIAADPVVDDVVTRVAKARLLTT